MKTHALIADVASFKIMKAFKIGVAGAALLMSSAVAMAQTGASPADPNNERNQRPGMSNTQPSDPATDTPSQRVPTDPNDASSADREEGGATGGSSGESGIVPPELAPAPNPPAAQ